MVTFERSLRTVSQLLLLHAPQEVQCDVQKCLSAAPPLLFILTIQHLLTPSDSLSILGSTMRDQTLLDLDPASSSAEIRVLVLLEDHIVTFVKNELKKIQTVLTSDYPECLESQRTMRSCWTVRMKSRGGAERHF
ncbi:hypothetical protein F7725_025755 [Dissostichus mawsoni]|uniref:Uncharacterized protein n=1 Tax=Dissostichus mawsoni TaxID=36200 RepID=A0A7J5X545_DISMA|nr:hypothetical protein F7725_025755 [Dissostichus mawsoni]